MLLYSLSNLFTFPILHFIASPCKLIMPCTLHYTPYFQLNSSSTTNLLKRTNKSKVKRNLILSYSAHTFIPVDLRCDTKATPVGTTGTPTFSWKFQSTSNENGNEKEGRNRMQKAYQVVVERENDHVVVWDTNRVISNVNHRITPPLLSNLSLPFSSPLPLSPSLM
jgi:hypothetical protein